MAIKAIITGATGMVGEGVLGACLNSPDVEAVLIINRKPSGFSHPKLKEIVHNDFFNLAPVANQLSGYNACYFCLGVSVVGMKEKDYDHTTYDLTLNFAKTLLEKNPSMTFCYVSGSGTDSTEKGKTMWARIKGKTENDLMKLPFNNVYAFRPGIMIPAKGAKNIVRFYRVFALLMPLLKLIIPNQLLKLHDVGNAMIYLTQHDYEKNHIEISDIRKITELQHKKA